jgi:hypothetical protein
MSRSPSRLPPAEVTAVSGREGPVATEVAIIAISALRGKSLIRA